MVVPPESLAAERSRPKGVATVFEPSRDATEDLAGVMNRALEYAGKAVALSGVLDNLLGGGPGPT